jgi:hypothetical protein
MANQEPNKPQLHLTRPLDRSLESFKTWLMEMTQALVPGAPDDMTEEDWIDAHKKFWEKVDKNSPPQ